MLITTKSELMRQVAAGIHHESFEHETEGVFDITLTRAWAKQHLQPVVVNLSDIVPFIMAHRVVEESRIKELTSDQWQLDPGIALLLNTGKHLMIDGHHRAIRAEREGWKFFAMYMVPENNAVRPRPGWGRANVDWGDPIVDGVIIRKGRP